MSFELGHSIVEDSEGRAEQQIFLAHGILGSSRNWRSFAQKLVKENPAWRVILVDLPAHGGSREAPGPFTLPGCSDHLINLATRLGRPRVLIGHSFGGKVVTQVSMAFGPEPLAVVVLDCPLLSVESETPSNSEIGSVVDLIDQVLQPVDRRSGVSESFKDAGFSPSLAGWMATNLVRNPNGEGYVWHFNREAIPELLTDYWARDFHAYLNEPGQEREFLLVKAENSDRFSTEEIAQSLALNKVGKAQWRELPNAGHWLHIDNPEGLLEILSGFLSDLY